MSKASPQQIQQSEALFNQNFQAIQQAKQQTGDWEKAYQMVTGQPWPKGQHVVIGDDGAHARKDSGILGKVAKAASIAAPIAATVLTGGAASPLMMAGIGAGTGALSSAANGGGWKGALTGAALGGATSFGGAKLGQMLRGAGSVGKGVAGMAGTPSEGVTSILNQAGDVPMGSLISDVNATSKSGGSWMSKLLGGAKNLINKGDGTPGPGEGPGQGWADMGSVLGGYAQSEANNRMAKGNFLQNYDQLNIRASEENRAREGDALKNLARTSYLMGGGAQPMNRQLNSGTMPDLGFGPKPASAAQMQGAGTLQAEMLKRLTPEGQIKPTDPNQYINRGVGEKITNWGSLGAGALGAAKTIWG